MAIPVVNSAEMKGTALEQILHNSLMVCPLNGKKELFAFHLRTEPPLLKMENMEFYNNKLP